MVKDELPLNRNLNALVIAIQHFSTNALARSPTRLGSWSQGRQSLRFCLWEGKDSANACATVWHVREQSES